MRANAMVAEQACAAVSESGLMGRAASVVIKVEACASVLRLLRSPVRSAFATSSDQCVGTSASALDKLAATASA